VGFRHRVVSRRASSVPKAGSREVRAYHQRVDEESDHLLHVGGEPTSTGVPTSTSTAPEYR
jgi:hypothetical protein